MSSRTNKSKQARRRNLANLISASQQNALHNEDESSDSESESDASMDPLDRDANIRQFIMMILNMAPKQQMTKKEILQKISVTFGASMSDLTGKTPFIFFNAMKRDKLISEKQGNESESIILLYSKSTEKETASDSESVSESDLENEKVRRNANQSDFNTQQKVNGENVSDHETDRLRSLLEEEEDNSDDKVVNKQSTKSNKEENDRGRNDQKTEIHKGIVQTYIVQKGYGFIRGNNAENDIVFYREDIRMDDDPKTRSLHVGDAVEFEIERQADGRTKAVNVRLDPNHSSQRIRGTVVNWNNERGFGFVRRNDDGTQVFVHFNGFNDDDAISYPNAGVKEGDLLEFEVNTDPKTGKQHAVRVSIEKRIEPLTKDTNDSSKRVRGVCVQWKMEKSFGFVRDINAKAEDADVFVHKSNLNADLLAEGGYLEKGDVVTYEIKRNLRNNKMKAIEVSREKKASEVQLDDGANIDQIQGLRKRSREPEGNTLDEDSMKEPAKKKQKRDDLNQSKSGSDANRDNGKVANITFSSNDNDSKKNDESVMRVDVPTIKLTGKGAVQQAREIIKQLQELISFHDVHCHFE